MSRVKLDRTENVAFLMISHQYICNRHCPNNQVKPRMPHLALTFYCSPGIQTSPDFLSVYFNLITTAYHTEGSKILQRKSVSIQLVRVCQKMGCSKIELMLRQQNSVHYNCQIVQNTEIYIVGVTKKILF